jgi:ABC-type nickel/cobalt efflux system permease component RcnA
MHTGFGIALLLSAFALGFRHGIDWDHIAAITDITSSQSSVRTGLRFATLYAAGHSIIVFVIGIVAIGLGRNLPKSVDEVMTRVVGATLILLGVYVLYALIRYKSEFRMRSRWMLIFSGVRNLYRKIQSRTEPLEHEHEHAELAHHGDGGTATLPVKTHTHSHSHTDPFMNYGQGTSFAVGLLHGVGAETPTQVVIFLAASGAGGVTAGIVVLATFLVGLFSANSALAIASASGFLAAGRSFKVYATVSAITGCASFVLGMIFLLGKTALLPAIFGG